MKKLKLAIVLFISMLMTVSLFAQEDEQTIEELYLQSQVKVKIIRAEAESVDRDMKMIAIQDIEKMVGDGEIAEDDREMVGILSSLGTEGISNQVIEQGAVINNYPMVRKEAVRLLGEVGGDMARDALVNVLLTDDEPMVLAEAVVALSKVGPDEQGVAMAVLADSMRSQTALKKDNNFANAFILAVANLAEANDGIDDIRVFEELTKIADPRSGYITVVRKKAFELLKNLQDF
ncbi:MULTISPECIES: HEAT repeat domain-containing protein [unclassified Oceanispirochaeta]|uniref:HEAT repeat domain-containing protein n=1 Tax=unclassified Oceanispirochaeta TaxID=2635722 RepID=UPI000E08F034|nr:MULTISPECIES: HEAT repeat domain-containing protein [unclassified Oceanispirochaeta]MBF9016113.1 HEAT repeat domain-containing protein [Oceanispirochaeta sp. M2]NPD72575.1 HEAT repeat domain-containing protein [Oceanispirochaeta sp. M1]RDG32030.1 HEAT repeat domain-containing protein [Oceanispirochaeta sp. M1]